MTQTTDEDTQARTGVRAEGNGAVPEETGTVSLVVRQRAKQSLTHCEVTIDRHLMS